MELDKVATTMALLTPLLLGLAALVKDFITRKDKKPDPVKKEEDVVVQGMTIPASDYAGELIAELKAEKAEDKAEIKELRARLQAYLEIDRRNQ